MQKSNQNPIAIGPILIIAAGIILILGLIVWEIASFAIQQQSSNSGSILPVVQPNRYTEVPLPAIARVTAADAKQAYDSGGGAVFIDVRSATSYGDSHVKDALNIPLNDLPNQLKVLDPQRWIIPYCT
jgi:hypothetical protein